MLCTPYSATHGGIGNAELLEAFSVPVFLSLLFSKLSWLIQVLTGSIAMLIGIRSERNGSWQGSSNVWMV